MGFSTEASMLDFEFHLVSGVTYMRIFAIPVLLFLLGAVSAQAGMILDGVNDSLYRSWSNQFPSAGLISGGGSGTLIAPDLVLTAAHVNLGDFTIGGKTYTGASIVRHPQYVLNGNNLNFGFDIAVIRLSTIVDNVTPTTWYKGTAELGKVMSLTGFGQTGVGSLASPSGGGVARAGTNTIDLIESFSNGSGGQVGAQNAILLADFDSPNGFGAPGQYNTMGSATPNPLEYHLATGDSGGGVFLQENGVWYVAGVNSGVSSQFDLTQKAGDNTQIFGYGAVSYITRVSSFQDFIEIHAVPEPSSILLSASAVLACAAGYRIRRNTNKSEKKAA
jgi:hypothetical protein